ncbi:transcriptional regulator PpsR [Loktanella sp. SALINAS62]|uniref:transcriptional regulator PpsR n=1 Tax=Loktanella sp. SALINAS62 TaxID=2706124 RepID=UPI001B8CA927|nr:transcriptional regulator PpsR [Loktanella sp. SALINAS62]MBS1302297.1 transcriptional regulator PpsR [Loktanella sp. SALINAS62]
MTSGGIKYWKNGDIPMIGPDILGGILASVSDVGLVVSETGIVMSVLLNRNFSDDGLFDKVEGREVADLLMIDSKEKFTKRLSAFIDGDDNVRPIEVNHTIDGDRTGLPVRYSFHRISEGGVILMLGHDLRPVAEMQQQLVSAQLALERDYEAQRDYETRFKVLMDSSTDGVVMVSAQSDKINDLNAEASRLVGTPREELVGRSFTKLFDARSQPTLIDRLGSLAMSDDDGRLSVKSVNGTPLTLRPTMFRSAGERILLCRIRSASDAMADQDRTAQVLRGIYDAGPDGIVFTSEEGAMLSANDGFLNMIGAAHDLNLRGTPFMDFLQRGMVDFSVMTQNAARAGSLRSYATRIAGDYGSPRDVDMSVTAIKAADTTIFAFVIREQSQTESLKDGDDDSGLSSVVELVGSSTLRDIVAETTNVVEKMCIETAIELTSNNRVAAAEMLGLSRQSLYVKLRKFGLIGQSND